jgi:hypothetical protein
MNRERMDDANANVKKNGNKHNTLPVALWPGLLDSGKRAALRGFLPLLGKTGRNFILQAWQSIYKKRHIF